MAGDGGIEEWGDLRREAAGERDGSVARTLLDEPLVSDYLAAGLEEFGLSRSSERTTPTSS